VLGKRGAPLRHMTPHASRGDGRIDLAILNMFISKGNK
jgi:hypothetical protein